MEVGEVAAPGYRDDIVDGLPRPLGAVLDIGCGEGFIGAGLRAAGATRLIGVEPRRGLAKRAEDFYDEVLVAPAESALDVLDDRFQTILCLDVLEHMADPAPVLARLRRVAAPGARLQLSVPNARHFSLVGDLVLRGTFGYTETGHRDRTHLRWFTRRDIVAAVEQAGWTVQRVSHPALGRSARLDRVTGGRVKDFFAVQWYVLAGRSPDS